MSRPLSPTGAPISDHLPSPTLISQSGPPPMPINHYSMMKQPAQDIGVLCGFSGDDRVWMGGSRSWETDVRAATKHPSPPHSVQTQTLAQIHCTAAVTAIQKNTVCIQYEQVSPIYRLTGECNPHTHMHSVMKPFPFLHQHFLLPDLKCPLF